MTEKTETSNKKAFEFARGTAWMIDPIKDVAIIGGQNNEFKMPEEQWGDLDTECEEDNPLYDERCGIPLDPDYVNNIDAYGVITPVIITKIKLPDGTEVAAVVEGRQRIRAARVVNRRRKAKGEPPIKVAAMNRRGDDTQLMGVMIGGNVRVEDDQETKIDKLRRLINRGVSPEDAAITFGKSVTTIKGWLAYEENASSALKKAVENGRLSQSAASHIAKLPADQQEVAVKEALALPVGSKKVTRSAAKTAAKRASKPSSNAAETLGLREQKKLLKAIQDKKHPENTSEKTYAFWSGAEAMLSLIVGEADGVDERIQKIVDSMRAEKK